MLNKNFFFIFNKGNINLILSDNKFVPLSFLHLIALFYLAFNS